MPKGLRSHPLLMGSLIVAAIILFIDGFGVVYSPLHSAIRIATRDNDSVKYAAEVKEALVPLAIALACLVGIFLLALTENFLNRREGLLVPARFGTFENTLFRSYCDPCITIPEGAEKLLYWFVRCRDLDTIARELEEQFNVAAEKFGLSYARWMYRWHVIMEICSAIGDRFGTLLKLIGVGSLLELWKLLHK